MKLIDLRVTRAIPAPVENVFEVWIDPKSPGGPRRIRRGHHVRAAW